MNPPSPVTALGGKHEEDAEDRDGVEDEPDDRATSDRHWDVSLRVDHLLRGAVLEFETDVIEQNQWHEGEEYGTGRLEVGRRNPVDAVLEAVDHDRQREEAEHDDAHEPSGRGNPLAVAERRDRHDDREPDERQLEDVVVPRA